MDAEEAPDRWVSTRSIPSQEPLDIPVFSVPYQRIPLLKEEETKERAPAE